MDFRFFSGSCHLNAKDSDVDGAIASPKNASAITVQKRNFTH